MKTGITWRLLMMWLYIRFFYTGYDISVKSGKPGQMNLLGFSRIMVAQYGHLHSSPPAVCKYKCLLENVTISPIGSLSFILSLRTLGADLRRRRRRRRQRLFITETPICQRTVRHDVLSSARLPSPPPPVPLVRQHVLPVATARHRV